MQPGNRHVNYNSLIEGPRSKCAVLFFVVLRDISVAVNTLIYHHVQRLRVASLFVYFFTGQKRFTCKVMIAPA